MRATKTQQFNTQEYGFNVFKETHIMCLYNTANGTGIELLYYCHKKDTLMKLQKKIIYMYVCIYMHV